LPPAHRRVVAITLAVVALGGGLLWARLHAARLERDGELAAICAAARTRSELDRDYARYGITPVETFAGDRSRLAYTTLVTSLQSFSCLVELEGDRVRSAHPFRMTHAEAARFFELPRWAPGWAEDVAQAVRSALSSIGVLLTP
jgi:hypothetical protein